MTNPRLEISRCCGTTCNKPVALRQIKLLLELFKALTRFQPVKRRRFPRDIHARLESPVEVFDPKTKQRIGVFIPDARVRAIIDED